MATPCSGSSGQGTPFVGYAANDQIATYEAVGTTTGFAINLIEQPWLTERFWPGCPVWPRRCTVCGRALSQGRGLGNAVSHSTVSVRAVSRPQVSGGAIFLPSA